MWRYFLIKGFVDSSREGNNNPKTPKHKPFFLFFSVYFYFTILSWFCHTFTWIHHFDRLLGQQKEKLMKSHQARKASRAQPPSSTSHSLPPRFPPATRANKAWASSMCQALSWALPISTQPALTTSLKRHPFCRCRWAQRENNLSGVTQLRGWGRTRWAAESPGGAPTLQSPGTWSVLWHHHTVQYTHTTPYQRLPSI